MRIGHGIQIPLRYPELLSDLESRNQCLEVCPTTYKKTGTLTDIAQLKLVFERCSAAGVDIAICTDNAGLHNVRLPFEYENLLTHDVIDFKQLQACQEAAFRHAFAWPHQQPPALMLNGLLQGPERNHPLSPVLCVNAASSWGSSGVSLVGWVLILFQRRLGLHLRLCPHKRYVSGIAAQYQGHIIRTIEY